MSSKSVRKRCPNYTPQEKTLLLTVISKYKHIVMNQKTDGATNEEKANCWKKIANEFNSQNPGNYLREADSIHRFFLNCVQNARKMAGEERKEMYKTGGGSKKVIDNDSNQDLLLSIINKKTVKGLSNEFDSDNIVQQIESAEVVFDDTLTYNALSGADLDDGPSGSGFSHLDKTGPLVSNAEQIHQNETSIDRLESQTEVDLTENEFSWKKYKGNDLQRPKSNCLQTCKRTKAEYDSSRRRPSVSILTSSHVAEKYDHLLDRRIIIADLEIERLKNLKERDKEDEQIRQKRQRLEMANFEKQCEFEEKERQLKLQNIKLEIQLKKQKLNLEEF